MELTAGKRQIKLKQVILFKGRIPLPSTHLNVAQYCGAGYEESGNRMTKITKNEQIEAVTGWWNSGNIRKFDKQYDDWDHEVMRYQNSRQTKVLNFVDELNLPNGAKILELGYGAGQTAVKLGQRGFEVHGIDVSDNLCKLAKGRCEKACPEGKFFLTVGNVESRFNYEDETFDAVLMVGIMHYLFSADDCLKEVNRVLNSNGHLIVAQRKVFSMAHFLSMRMLIRSLVYVVCREQYELFPSYKSILCDSNLGVIFGKFKDTKWMNTKFMLKGHDEWKFKLKKRIYDHGKLMSLCKRTDFKVVGLEGTFFGISENPKYHKLNVLVGNYLEGRTQNKFNGYLKRLGGVAVILCRKREQLDGIN